MAQRIFGFSTACNHLSPLWQARYWLFHNPARHCRLHELPYLTVTDESSHKSSLHHGFSYNTLL